MNGELIWVLSLLLIAIILFATGKVRMDAVALFVIVAFVLSGTLTLPEAFSGFSDPNVILIAALFIIGDGLVRTGVATIMGAWLVKVAGSSETKMLIYLMLTVAGLGAFMSSTGVVAIFIPVVLSVSMRMQSSPSRLMMPLSFAGLISGMMTLVATPPTGSQVSPRLCSMPISAAFSTCSGVPPSTSARPAAAIAQAEPTSPWQPTSAPEIDAFFLHSAPTAAAASRKVSTSRSLLPGMKSM